MGRLQNAGWLAIFACLVFAFGAEIWRASQKIQHHEYKQPSVAEQKNVKGGKPITLAVEDKKQPKRQQESNRYSVSVSLGHLPDWFVAVFTGLLVYVTFLLVKATSALRISTDNLWEAGERQLTLAHPPRVLVKNVSVWPKGREANREQQPIVFTPGAEFEIEAYIVNLGREKITLTDAKCMAYWRTPPLPMKPPWQDLASEHFSRLKTAPDFRSEVIDMAPGVARWRFEAPPVPSNFVESMKLYVMGIVVYRDRLNIYRPTLFCRRYDPSERRFIPEQNNADYEAIE